jgi:hypothetical protein
MSGPPVELLQARLKIECLLCSYADALDAGQVEKVAALFRRGQIRIHGMSAVHAGERAVQDMFLRFTCFYDRQMQLADPTQVQARPWTRHLSSNLHFDALGQDEAVVWSSFTVLQGFPGEDMKPIVSGRYCDTVKKDEAGEWYFTDRLEFIDLVGDVSRHLKGNPLAG